MSKVLIETSARHVHVSKADLETLFGAGYELTKKKDLSQPGQFACEERVAVIDVTIETQNLDELNNIIKLLRKVDSVYEVTRKK